MDQQEAPITPAPIKPRAGREDFMRWKKCQMFPEKTNSSESCAGGAGQPVSTATVFLHKTARSMILPGMKMNALIFLLVFIPSIPVYAVSPKTEPADEWTSRHQQAWDATDAKDLPAFQKLFQEIQPPHARHKLYKDTLLSHSITKGAFEIAVWMLDRGINPNDQSTQLPLNNVLSRSDLFGDKAGLLIEKLLEKGADPNAVDKKGQTPLHLFAGHIGEVHIIQLLIEKGARASLVDEEGDTPLHKMIGHWLGEDAAKVAELLVAAGADPKAKNKDGKTALDMLLSRSNPDSFPELKLKLEALTR